MAATVHRTPTAPTAARTPCLVWVCVLVVAGIIGCDDRFGLERPGELPADWASARRRAVAYFEGQVDGRDASWGSLFGYMHRRFGLVVQDRNGSWLHEPVAGRGPQTWTRLYDRLDDPGVVANAAEIAGIRSETDRMTALALHCDRVALPENWPEVLRAASKAGGYALTHAALAVRWTIENGCASASRLAPIVALQRERLAEMAASRDLLEERYPNGTDLWLESIVMLYYLGGRAAVDDSLVREVVALQRADGGWPLGRTAAGSDPHATALAMWILLEKEQPDAPPIRWIAAPTRGAPAPSSR